MMKRLALTLALLAFSVPALGQTTVVVKPYIYIPLGYQQITAGTLAAATALTVPAGASIAEICVDTAPVRYRDDGTSPTASVGMSLAASACFQYSGSLSAIKFILQSGSPVLNVSYYK